MLFPGLLQTTKIPCTHSITQVCNVSLRVRHGPQMMSFRRELPSTSARLTGGRPANKLIRRTGSARRGDPWAIILVVMWARPIVSPSACCKRQKCKLALVISAGWAWERNSALHSQSQLVGSARARFGVSWLFIGGCCICLLWLADPSWHRNLPRRRRDNVVSSDIQAACLFSI